MLEQAAENISSDYKLDLTDTAIISQAISLKRIADALEKIVSIPTMQPLTEEQAKKFEQAKIFEQEWLKNRV